MTRADLPLWDVDTAHSSVGFRVRHMLVSKVTGRFTRWQGTLAFQPDHLGDLRVEATIDPVSVETHDAQRDAHLRSADFLDPEQFPEIAFRSTGVEPDGRNGFRMAGELTVHGTTLPVILRGRYGGRIKDPQGRERVGFSASTSVDRRRFGLQWNQALEAGGWLVGDQVEVQIEAQAVRRP